MVYIENKTPYKFDFELPAAQFTWTPLGIQIFDSSKGLFNINNIPPNIIGTLRVEDYMKSGSEYLTIFTGGRYASKGKVTIKDASSGVNYGTVEFKMTEGTLGVDQVSRSKKEGTGDFLNIDEVIEVTVTTEWAEDGYRIIVESSGPGRW